MKWTTIFALFCVLMGVKPAWADMRVTFTKMTVNDCNEIGVCDWKLMCGLGNQNEVEFFRFVEADTQGEIRINRSLTQKEGPPITVNCSVHEHDGGINAQWEVVGSAAVVVTNTGPHTINAKNDEGDVTIHFTVERIGTIDQPLSVPQPRLLWSHADGRISLWKMGSDGQQLGYREHGPYPGWTAVNYSDGRILWRNADGRISLWTVDADGKQLSYEEHGPYVGWTVVNYSGQRILWRHADGRISLWTLDQNGKQLSYQEHGPYAGWSVVNYRDGVFFGGIRMGESRYGRWMRTGSS